MKQFIEGVDRQQAILLPEYLDDYVDENNPVQAIDAFVDLVDLAVLDRVQERLDEDPTHFKLRTRRTALKS